MALNFLCLASLVWLITAGSVIFPHTVQAAQRQAWGAAQGRVSLACTPGGHERRDSRLHDGKEALQEPTEDSGLSMAFPGSHGAVGSARLPSRRCGFHRNTRVHPSGSILRGGRAPLGLHTKLWFTLREPKM